MTVPPHDTPAPPPLPLPKGGASEKQEKGGGGFDAVAARAEMKRRFEEALLEIAVSTHL